MRTVTFYSYKGGTGRTLLLANIAVFAARLGRRVVAIDVDLEAPGLSYKLLGEPPTRCDGVVGWLRDRLSAGEPPLSLGDFLIDIPVVDPFVEGGSLQLMPAGRNPSLNYFQDLTGLRLEQRLAEGDGVDAFLDLQAQLREDLAPDLILLDARTGIRQHEPRDHARPGGRRRCAVTRQPRATRRHAIGAPLADAADVASHRRAGRAAFRPRARRGTRGRGRLLRADRR